MHMVLVMRVDASMCVQGDMIRVKLVIPRIGHGRRLHEMALILYVRRQLTVASVGRHLVHGRRVMHV